MTDTTETATPSLGDGDTLRSFVVRHDGRGDVEVALDGRNITQKIHAYHIDVVAGDPATGGLPMVVLELHPRAAEDMTFAGMAHVAIGDPPPIGDAAAAFLEAIDAEKLEQAALNREDLPVGTLTEAMLRQLIEWARGQS